MFDPAPQNVSFPKLEEEVLKFWRERDIYQKSLDRRATGPKFVFFEGPPTANGMPHPGHCLTRAIKDLFPRYRTMRGYYCRRKAGWDTHGLPVEVEVSKELGIHSKEEIVNFGEEQFIQKCQQSVWRYMQEWEKLTERLGFWIKLDEAYVTYHQSFVESVWWSLKQLFDRGLLYQGHKIVWWWAQGGTALSSGEVGQGYRQVADPSVYVKFPLLDDKDNKTDTSLVVWTTTPWTLPSNQFAAVNPELTYATVTDSETGEKLILAEALVETIAGKIKRDLKVEKTCQGADLLGRRYLPPFDYYYKSQGKQTGKLKAGGEQAIAWRIVPAAFVTTDSGSGVVHQAPAFGEVDYEVLVAEGARFVDGAGPQLINAVGPDGKFTAEAPDYQGRWVKDADKDIVRRLKDEGKLFHREEYLHEYPFCWRADQDPLIQYPRKSWFIKTSQYKEEMLANNAQINWLPEHIKEGRFGNFLETNVDWALSRERFWGTPLPIWVCEKTGQMEAVSGYDDLLKKPGVKGTEVWTAAKKANPALVEDLKVHKPYIDAITYDSPFSPGARMRRVSEVIDGWYDSGAMPFAQWGYRGEDGPPKAKEQFHDQFPADFISEAIDQTRGWFYSQLAISTLLFGEKGTGARGEGAGGAAGSQPASNLQSEISNLQSFPYPHPFKNCIVLGLMLGEDGQKMSKSKRNYREPNEIFTKYGADALRWYFYANQPPWTSIRYKEQAIKDSIPEFLLRFWNCYKFFVEYAAIDGFDPAARLPGKVEQLSTKELATAKGYRPPAQRPEIDRWVLSELNRMVSVVVERMDAYDNFTACGAINSFVDALSNWYIRRCRDRFWGEEKESPDKLDAYWTLYECLLTTCKTIAPFVPFIAETLWSNLTRPFAGKVLESVHLCDFPTSDASQVDVNLSRRMDQIREIVSLGRSARMNEKLKVRQPLSRVEVTLTEPSDQEWFELHSSLIADELNVKEVAFLREWPTYINWTILPELKRLGPRLGKRLSALKKVLSDPTAINLVSHLEHEGSFELDIGQGEPVSLTRDDLIIRLNADTGWAAATGRVGVVCLATNITPELKREGIARDIVRNIQDKRKELDFNLTDRLQVTIVSDSEAILAAVAENSKYVASETLADELNHGSIRGTEHATQLLAGDSEKFEEQEIDDDQYTLFIKRLGS